MSWAGSLFGGSNPTLNNTINQSGQIGGFATGLGMGNLTAGSTATNLMEITFGAAGPGGWVAPNPDAMPKLKPASTTASMDILSATGGTSLPFSLTVQIAEL